MAYLLPRSPNQIVTLPYIHTKERLLVVGCYGGTGISNILSPVMMDVTVEHWDFNSLVVEESKFTYQ